MVDPDPTLVAERFAEQLADLGVPEEEVRAEVVAEVLVASAEATGLERAALGVNPTNDELADASVTVAVEERFTAATGLQLFADRAAEGEGVAAPSPPPPPDPDRIVPATGVLAVAADVALTPVDLVSTTLGPGRAESALEARAERLADRADVRQDRLETRGERYDPLGLLRDTTAFLFGEPALPPASPAPAPREAVDLSAFIDERTEGEGDPYGAVVAVGTGGRWACTGTLIARRVVLTAAHCLPADRVLAGVTDTRTPGVEARVLAHARHPGGLDIALLAIDEDLKVATSSWRIAGDTSAPGDLTLVGFGVDGGRAGRRKELPVRTDSWGCEPVSAGSFGCRPGAELVLTPKNGADTCVGDSGGPAFESIGTSLRLVAVTSRPVRNATVTCGDGGIYVRLDAASDWILRTLPALAATTFASLGGP